MHLKRDGASQLYLPGMAFKAPANIISTWAPSRNDEFTTVLFLDEYRPRLYLDFVTFLRKTTQDPACTNLDEAEKKRQLDKLVHGARKVQLLTVEEYVNSLHHLDKLLSTTGDFQSLDGPIATDLNRIFSS